MGLRVGGWEGDGGVVHAPRGELEQMEYAVDASRGVGERCRVVEGVDEEGAAEAEDDRVRDKKAEGREEGMDG